MPFTVPIFTEFMPDLQLFGKNSYTKSHKNLTHGLVADTRSWTDVVSKYAFFFTSKRVPKKLYSHSYQNRLCLLIISVGLCGKSVFSYCHSPLFLINFMFFLQLLFFLLVLPSETMDRVSP
jgi:hypothetical protein